MNTKTRKPAADLSRAELLDMVASFVNSRPGFDWRNYGDATSYRADMREATQQRHDALKMLAAIGWRDSINANAIRAALQSGGRLSLSDSGRLEYCAGQYYPTEFRAGACRVLSQLLWDYFRETASPTHPTPNGRTVCGDDIRRKARQEFGRGCASRWFR